MPAPAPAPAPDRHTRLLARALAHVDAHLDQPLDAHRLADEAAMSRHHFHRVFHAHLGCSVGDYITWRRLQRACALLVSGREPVLEVALAAGYQSAQALAKVMRRELGVTPTAVRAGGAATWKHLSPPWRPAPPPTPGDPAMQPIRHSTLPPGLCVLTATARGMVDRTLTRAARQAFGELVPAIARAGLMARVSSWMSVVPDDPQGPDDPHCRYIAAAMFGHAMAEGRGQCERPDFPEPLTGSLAWQDVAPGRYAVFLHVGPYTELHRAWDTVYREWLPASGASLRDVPPLELMLNDPETTPPAELRTEIWVPVD